MSFKKKRSRVNALKQRDAFFDNLLQSLPPVFPRKDIPKYLGNLLSVGYIANLDSAGLGPESRRVGGNVVYERESFVLWLVSRTEGVGK